MAQLLNIPYHPQKVDGYCLPACAQMALAHLGIFHTQETLARKLQVRLPLGAPASNLTRLQSNTLDVTCAAGGLADVAYRLAQNIPVIVFIQAGELSHWRGHTFQHAVVVIGLDDQTAHLLDPAAGAAPISVSTDEFLLAWGEMDYLYAIIIKKK